MDEKGFELFLTPQLGLSSVRSYLSYCRRVEKSLEIVLGLTDLSDAAVANIEGRLARLGGPFASSSVSNCMMAIRRYAEFLSAVPGEKLFATRSKRDVWISSKIACTCAGLEEPVVARAEVVSLSGIRELLILHSQIMDELRDRGIVRTGNGPAGDYAEKLFERAFGLAAGEQFEADLRCDRRWCSLSDQESPDHDPEWISPVAGTEATSGSDFRHAGGHIVRRPLRGPAGNPDYPFDCGEPGEARRAHK